MKKTEATVAAPTFSKAQILGSERYRGRRDLADALLEDDKRYTLQEVDKLIAGYLNRKF